MDRYVLAYTNNRSTYRQIFPFDHWNVRLNFDKYFATRIVERSAFVPYSKRVRQLGLSGTAFQTSFTVACSFSHRRAWQTFLQTNNTIAVVTEDDAVRMSPISEEYIQNILLERGIEWDMIQLGAAGTFAKRSESC